ncbi:GH25 family lysozyme M1 (1,4-beta-N-acetylmuramidase) [Amycolatopsis sulphurea]|uniref:Lysozyme n=1 Tax=Amycolatopsis sulphurea TaxID=76022 RepID=A0A2A9FBP2_9PSEU|nr:GH25 family lysozyme M1 (1,4-beta-N-acetylmuramidase) [Amycolatopsis sulphurea]
MKSRHPLLRWSAVLLAGVTGAALCTTSAATAAPSYAGAQDNYAGSQIARHEGVAGSPVEYSAADQLLGHDVSGHQGAVNWAGAASAGAKFVYIKATEGTGFVNPQFAQQYNGAYGAGIVRGSYHFARPDVSDGAAQAEYFLAHGGGWSADGKTLPGALDAEYNPYGETCYGKDAAGMVAWIKAFSETYRARTGRLPTIYTSTSWWKTCTGNSAAFGGNPLWLARYNTKVGELPAGWGQQAIWQFANSGSLPGDQNWLNGTASALRNLAIG